MVFMMIWKWFSHTQSCRFTSFQNARKSCFNFVGSTTPTMLLHNFARHSRSNWCFQFLSNILNGFFEFLVLRVNEYIPRNLLALSSFGFSFDHLCFSFSLVFLPNFVQSSGHKWSGLDVTCRLFSLLLDHIYPSGGFSSNRVNWVKPVQESDESLDPSIFQ